MASSSSLCGVCNFRNIHKESVIWCMECDEELCSDCEEHHGVSTGTRHHSTISISEYQSLPRNLLETSQICKEHNEKYQTFCKKHDIPCCSKCVIESHNKCEPLAYIDDVIQYVKSSHAFLDMEDMLTVVTENLERLCKYRQTNEMTLKDQKDKIEKKIKETRQTINNHLDRIQGELMEDLKLKEKLEKKKIEDLSKPLEEMKEKLHHLRTDIKKIKQHASDLQTFLAMKQMQLDIVSTDNFIESVVKSGPNQTILSCDIDSILRTILEKVTKFGEIHVQRNPSKISLVKHKEKEAQIPITGITPKSIDHLTVKLEKTLDTKSNVMGCTILQDGRIAVTDYSDYNLKGKIQVYNNDGSVDFDIPTDFKTYALSNMKEDNVVAVTSYDQGKISIIDINQRKTIKTFNVDQYNSSITVRDNTILYSSERTGIRQLNLTDTSVSDFMVTCMESYIATYRDNVYYTHPFGNTVACYDLQGRKKWEFGDCRVLHYPAGITVDNAGNVYVAGGWSHNVVVFSPDGQHHRQILSDKDGLKYPEPLYYDRSNNTLLVISTDKAFLFKVT